MLLNLRGADASPTRFMGAYRIVLVDFLVDHCGSDDGANAVTTAAVTASARKMGRKAIMVCTDWNYLCVWNDVVEKVVGC